MLLYGRMLLQHEPEATTELLIDLCSGQLGRKPSVAPASDKLDNGTTGNTGPAVLSYLGVNKVAGLFTADSPSSVPNTGGAGSRMNGASTEQAQEATDANNSASADVVPAYDPPSPRQYFAHFVDHQTLFIKFLESVASTLWKQKVSVDIRPDNIAKSPRPAELPEDDDPKSIDQRAVWNTLLELYLSSFRTSDREARKVARSKALGLLADKDKPYDPAHAMILCSTAGFTDGLVGLWESMGMYEDVLRFWMDQDKDAESAANGASTNGDDNTFDEAHRHPSDEVLRCLDLYGPTNLHLYPLVLRYLTSSTRVLSRQSSHIRRILAAIDEHRILPPLAVVQLLSRNGVASVGTVKEWLKSKVEETRQDVQSDKRLVESYRNETKEKEKQLKDIANTDVPETFQVTRCAACQGQLDLPSVHFMCKHSYHQRSVPFRLRCSGSERKADETGVCLIPIPSASSALDSTRSSAKCDAARRDLRTGTTCSLMRCMRPRMGLPS